MPRGRFPSGAVAMGVCVAASMTVRSPDASFVTNTRRSGFGVAAAAGGAAVAGAGVAGSRWQPAAAHATSMMKMHVWRYMRGCYLTRVREAGWVREVGWGRWVGWVGAVGGV